MLLSHIWLAFRLKGLQVHSSRCGHSFRLCTTSVAARQIRSVAVDQVLGFRAYALALVRLTAVLALQVYSGRSGSIVCADDQ